MGSGSNPLQKAIYQALTGDTALCALLAGGQAGVVDQPTQEQALPYVTIGEDLLQDWGSFGRTGEQGTITLHSWSQEHGKAQVKGIMNRIDSLLHRQDLALEGGHVLVGLMRDMAQVLTEPDGLSFHGVQRFRIWIQNG